MLTCRDYAQLVECADTSFTQSTCFTSAKSQLLTFLPLSRALQLVEYAARYFSVDPSMTAADTVVILVSELHARGALTTSMAAAQVQVFFLAELHARSAARSRRV